MIKYFFYDMDDTLVSTRDKWLGAIRTYQELQGIPYGDESAAIYLGKNCKDICLDIDARYHHIGSEGVDYHAAIFRGFLSDQFNMETPPEIPGAGRFLDRMAASVRQYIVSGSPLPVIAQVIRRRGWLPLIADYSSSDTIAHGKPDPQIYNTLKRKLRAKNGECLIFEDSPAGVEAARHAGIRYVCVNPRSDIEKSDLLVCSVVDFRALMDGAAISGLMESESGHEPH